MDVSSPYYGRSSCRPSFWNFVRNQDYSQAIIDGEMWWLRLYTQPIFISYQCHIYISSVWQPLWAVDVHMDVSTLRYSRSCRPSFWNFARNLGNSQPIPHGEMWWSRLHTQPIFISHQCYIYKVFDNLYMLWMWIWMCSHHAMATHADQAFGISLSEIWAAPRQ